MNKYAQDSSEERIAGGPVVRAVAGAKGKLPISFVFGAPDRELWRVYKL